jgi:gliding motility-associated protein GldL
MSTNKSKFDIWWNSTKVKRVVGAIYSIGASIVIIGAMGKILHTSWGGAMLGVGMGVEAFLFFIGVFDKPHEEFDWNKVFSFENDNRSSNPMIANAGGSKSQVATNNSEIINDKDIQKLSEGIKNLTNTADQLSSLSSVVTSTDRFVKNIDSASEVASKYISTQALLNTSTVNLNSSYQGINDGMLTVENNTKTYAKKVDEINKSLSSIHSLYEIQIKNIQSQSEGISTQKELVNEASDEYKTILSEVQKIKASTLSTTENVESFKLGSEKLKSQVSELNQIYGNMLNALN